MGKKYYKLNYTGDIKFNEEILKDPNVIIKEDEKAIYFSNKNKFIKSYVNESWLHDIIKQVADRWIENFEKNNK